ncbi:accessory gland-specific peptide 57Da [Drosophila teissieri]|uniref:accessory gland-specific peptide 57Da n=1 Tax=Drosophila teissieri TaxID=7243 RepID=UPI001CB9E9EA|nr:accessory gland-specific peptide 57Da [Drosophila teissieri]
MKFLALFVTLLVVLAMVNGQKPSKTNTNHNVIVIGGKKPAAAPSAPAPAADAPAAL